LNEPHHLKQQTHKTIQEVTYSSSSSEDEEEKQSGINFVEMSNVGQNSRLHNFLDKTTSF
jgi:hypothetical protein